VKIEGRRWRFSAADDLTVEERGEAAHAICRFLVDPPQTPKHRRAVVIRTLLARYEGPISRRAIDLEGKYLTYLDGADWRREQHLEKLPRRRGVEHVLLHRFGRVNGGRPLGWRQILRVAGPL
jgi:hypothetical protein